RRAGLVAADKPLALQHVKKTRAQIGARRLNRVQPRLLAVTDAGQQIAERIAQCHGPMPSLPARLDHARDLPLRGQFPQRDTRHAKLAVVTVRTPGDFAPIVDTRRRRVARKFGKPELCDEAILKRNRLVLDDRLERLALARIFLGELPALLVTLHGADLRHCLLPSRPNSAGTAYSCRGEARAPPRPSEPSCR